MICATALIAGIGDNGEPEYEGESEVHWDTQESQLRDGKTLFIDESGELWTFDQLVLALEDDEGDDD